MGHKGQLCVLRLYVYGTQLMVNQKTRQGKMRGRTLGEGLEPFGRDALDPLP